MTSRSDENVDQVLLGQYRAAQHRLAEARRRVEATAPGSEQREREQAEYDMRWVRLRELRQKIEDAP